MPNNEIMLERDENLIYSLRALYTLNGYTQFRMSKFEEYDLYGKNKDFLISDAVITFTDTTGKLMALKPDVTFSIIKNTDAQDGTVKRICYNENVYRMNESTHDFTEIMQSGVECIGDIDTYNLCEILMLAGKTLELTGEAYILDVSHLGFVRGLLEDAGECDTEAVLKCISEKNPHGLDKLLGVRAEKLKRLISIYGDFDTVISELEAINVNEITDMSLCELKTISEYLKKCEHFNIKLDFSAIGNMNYYNGIVFRGFVAGAPSYVLSGGRYDKLMKKLGKKSGAIGFALYHDRLKYLMASQKREKPVLVLYDNKTDISDIIATRKMLSENNETFELQKTINDEKLYKKVIDLTMGGKTK